MEKLNVRKITADARRCLEGRAAHRLAALHTGVTVAAALIVTGLQYALSAGIGQTAGLSGLGTRSMLETLQTLLQWANNLLMPFWSLGFCYAAMQWAEGRPAGKNDLLTGFYRFGPYLRLLFIRALIVIAVLIVCGNLSSIVYLMLPASDALTALVSGGDVNALLGQMTEATAMELLESMIPMLIIWGVLSIALLLPLLYRFRLAEYAILARPGTGALAALRISTVLTRRRWTQLLRLDLRLWWYYGLKLLCLGICYSDLLLSAAGISLPLGDTGLVPYIAYLAALFAVETCFRPMVETAYAGAYYAFLAMGAAPTPPQNVPAKMPWDVQ